jgi:O-succinylhomoserine sulfhydrylase
LDGRDLNAWEEALAPGATCVFLETPSNPTLEIIDLAAVAELSPKAGACLVVDNVFATPVRQRPLEYGADVVIYSATKHIDGQGRTLGGAVLGAKSFIDETLFNFMKHTGPSMSPFNAWVLVKGLETLEFRVRQHAASADLVARFLDGQAGVSKVLYAGLESHPQYELASRQMGDGGTIVAFELEGGKARAFRFLNALKLIDISNNLGDSKSLITHPSTTTHARLSAAERAELDITDGLLRLSIGLEDAEDIKDDLAQALTA